ncbi:MAG TPA: sigma-70 family RNA polymerase sigma factor [Tepidisphaeraceae bacterium]|nr:sigma-70 family RNA polymerase sigma factor [Tepidisphaeraceae bacterium]
MTRARGKLPLPNPIDFAMASDDALAGRARDGCRHSFDELARRFQVRLLRFLQGRVRGIADAEDLLQETLIRAYERMDQYDPARPFGTWLFTIAHRLAISHHRRAASSERGIEALVDRKRGAAVAAPDRQLADQESRQLFWEMAASVLTQEQFSTVWLFYVEDMPAPQIADVLGRSWVSVKTILFRARRKLMPHLQTPETVGLAPRVKQTRGVAALAVG